MITRRAFIRDTGIGAAGVAMLRAPKAWAGVSAANETVNLALLGAGGRAHSLVKAAHIADCFKIVMICDADASRMEKFKGYCQETLGYVPEAKQDFRKVLEKKYVDAVAISTPEHWHAPMAIMAMQAGKHVYLEKPCSHNPYENELLIAAQKKYGLQVQMGNQQRSSYTSALAKREIQEGIIGDVYLGKAFYANTRRPIGNGKVIPVPDYLDWDLWQGPAPREAYRDNIHPYNWHWFKTWGTGEIHNNGTHEIDVCRWMLGVEFPNRVVSTGGRLHYKGDDWEWFDTQLASYEFEEGKTIFWDGRSCNGFMPGGGRYSQILGTEGTIYLDRGKYVLYDLNGKKIKQENETNQSTPIDTSDTRGFDSLTVRHMKNFANAIRKGEELKSPIANGAISTQLCHLGNIALQTGESLKVDPANGKVLDNKCAAMLWRREYEKGWEPTI